MELILPWLPIILGSIIAVFDVRATMYFYRQLQMIGNNWVIRSLFRTAATITAVVIILTISRAILIVFSTAIQVEDADIVRSAVQFIAGLAVVWLSIIPIILRQYFEEHEGRIEEKYMKGNEEGQTLVEYGLLLALIAIVVIIALLALGPIISEIFNNIGQDLNNTP
jgi:pilus assembly protein Flp/PilA